MDKRKFVVTGAVLAGLGVILGAMASHALKGQLSEEVMNSFRTGVRFQFYHALAFLALGAGLDLLRLSFQRWIYYLMTIGTVLFSFSIYGLCLLPLMEINAQWLGPITPLGGTCLIAAWVVTALAATKGNN